MESWDSEKVISTLKVRVMPTSEEIKRPTSFHRVVIYVNGLAPYYALSNKYCFSSYMLFNSLDGETEARR